MVERKLVSGEKVIEAVLESYARWVVLKEIKVEEEDVYENLKEQFEERILPELSTRFMKNLVKAIDEHLSAVGEIPEDPEEVVEKLEFVVEKANEAFDKEVDRALRVGAKVAVKRIVENLPSPVHRTR